MSARAHRDGSSRRRVAAEVALLALILSAPFGAVSGDFHAEWRWSALALGQVYVGFFGAILGAIRMPSTSGGGRRRLGGELLQAVLVALATWAGAGLAHLGGALSLLARDAIGPIELVMFANSGAIIGGLGTLAGLPVFAVARGMVLVWTALDRLRRTRLLWALTHAQLVAAKILAVVVAIALVAFDVLATASYVPAGPDAVSAAAGPMAWALTLLTTRVLPAATVLVLLSAAAAAALLPPAALISFVVLRRTTRRLEALAAAAGALRAGDLGARVAVAGEDEVARLQAGFNAMAADLQHTMRDLQAERDRVVGLLDARRQLVASISHELRTPVATVRGYLESVLESEVTGPADGAPGPGVADAPDGTPGLGAAAALDGEARSLHADLETMRREVSRLERLIDDLFTLSRADVGRLGLRPGATDVGAVVRSLVETAAPLAWRQRRVEVLADVAPDLPPARADAERLEQVVSNLLGNAVRHTRPGGMVVAVVAAEADALRVSVRDTGEGIAPADLPRVFEPFYRGRYAEEATGAGLGLAIVKELVEAMGGSVHAASAPGKGSCFTVRLPRE